MLNKFRLKIATGLLTLASEKFNNGDFKHIKQGVKYMKYAVIITPPGPELDYFRNGLAAMIEQHHEKS